MEKALERTIETLIDSGGEKWEYDSNDIQILVQWIEDKQKQVNVVVAPVSKCLHPEPDRIELHGASDQCGICWKFIDK